MSDTLRERALRLLARREHARAELARKLAPYAESSEVLGALLDDLQCRHLLSDERYAEMRVNTRSSRYGNARLIQELRASGVDADTVDQALAAVEDELSRARQVWQRKFGADTPPVDVSERARQTNFLVRRGFSGDIIRRLLRGDYEGEQ
jgi:regulatory protein